MVFHNFAPIARENIALQVSPIKVYKTPRIGPNNIPHIKVYITAGKKKSPLTLYQSINKITHRCDPERKFINWVARSQLLSQVAFLYHIYAHIKSPRPSIAKILKLLYLSRNEISLLRFL